MKAIHSRDGEAAFLFSPFSSTSGHETSCFALSCCLIDWSSHVFSFMIPLPVRSPYDVEVLGSDSSLSRPVLM